MASLYDNESVQNVLEQYYNKGGEFYKIDGSLVDNYICWGYNLKTAIIKEVYLNEWSSASSITLYNKTPKKYEKVISAIQNGDEYEKIEKLFFRG